MSNLNIGQNVKIVTGQVPIGLDDGANVPVSIDTQGYRSLTIVITSGIYTGSPSAVSVPCVFTHSTDNSTFAANSTYDGTTITNGAASFQKINVPLDEAGINRYVKMTLTATFTTGSSPTIPVTVIAILGNGREMPIT